MSGNTPAERDRLVIQVFAILSRIASALFRSDLRAEEIEAVTGARLGAIAKEAAELILERICGITLPVTGKPAEHRYQQHCSVYQISMPDGQEHSFYALIKGLMMGYAQLGEGWRDEWFVPLYTLGAGVPVPRNHKEFQACPVPLVMGYMYNTEDGRQFVALVSNADLAEDNADPNGNIMQVTVSEYR
jgi:hypothetical protein